MLRIHRRSCGSIPSVADPSQAFHIFSILFSKIVHALFVFEIPIFFFLGGGGPGRGHGGEQKAKCREKSWEKLEKRRKTYGPPMVHI